MVKILGAVMIVFGCGSVGFKIALNQLRRERMLRQFLEILDYMESELQYRLTQLPELCRQASSHCSGMLSDIFLQLTHELENQVAPDVERCMRSSIALQRDTPEEMRQLLELFGRSLGKFDLNGQLKGIALTRHACDIQLEELTTDKDVRLRSYRTLALCAGAALAILFI